MGFITLDDRSGRMEVALFSDIYESVRELVEKDKVLLVEAIVAQDEYSGGLKATGQPLGHQPSSLEIRTILVYRGGREKTRRAPV